MSREPVTLVEIDMDGCGRTFGVAPCTAALSSEVRCKCFNTYATCAAKAAFQRVTRTLRFAEPRPGLPKGATIFPVLRKVTAFSSSVNLAGMDESLGALGRRATVTVELADFHYHDRLTDPYQSERVSGAAQWGGVGYDPAARGSFFPRLRARWPYYAGRAMRVVQGFLEGGALVDTRTRHFVITDMTASDDGRVWTFKGKDVLALADNDKAVAPVASRGALVADITAAATALTLTPAGIGATYPTSGRAVIGGELVDYTRAGDVVTMTARGIRGTAAAAHSAGDAFQTVATFTNARIDDVIKSLLQDYAGIPSAFIPAAEWQSEVSRWFSQVRLTTDICTPTGVAQLLGELQILGVGIWWDDVAQKIGLRVSRPTDGETVKPLSDHANIKAITLEDREDDRITEVMFFSVQIDPTKSATDRNNYRRVTLTPDLDAKGENAFADTKIKRIYSRWLNDGADGVVAVVSKRILRRFAVAPVRAVVRLDWQDAGLALVDVVSVQSAAFQDATGGSEARQMQVVALAEPEPGHELEATLQAFDYTARYGFATENTRPNYAASSAAQRTRGMYACDPVTLKMSNGDEPYRAI